MTTINKYAKGKIYRLVSNVDDEFYVGSTCLPLAKRFYKHKYTAKERPNMRVYEHFNTIGWEHIKIILVEEFPCENKMQLERREREVIEQLKPSLNQMVPTRTKKEWREDNRNTIAMKKKEDRDKNKERYKQSSKKHYENKLKEKVKCDCGIECTKANMKRHTNSKQHKKWLQNETSTSS
jgi:hypothetical protein